LLCQRYVIAIHYYPYSFSLSSVSMIQILEVILGVD